MRFFNWLFGKKDIKVVEAKHAQGSKKNITKKSENPDSILVQVPHAPQSSLVNPATDSNPVLAEESTKFFIFNEKAEIVGVKKDAPEVYKKAFESYKKK